MSDRLKRIQAKVLEQRNGLPFGQMAKIVSVSAGVILALTVLITVQTRTRYEVLITCETTKEASQIQELLEEASITYTITDNGLQIKVLASQIPSANLTLGANNIPAASYDIGDVTDGGFSKTESDKQKKSAVSMISVMYQKEKNNNV